MESVSIKELLTEKKYKNMSKSELGDIINYNLNYADYLLIRGRLSEEKATVIFLYFHGDGWNPNCDRLSLVELLDNKDFRNKSEKELSDIINYQITFKDFNIINGTWADDKAENLYSYFLL